ncbi:hypothetical protein JL193_02345 [Polaribacter batillariae]|uniref:Uncharacterized protein n=1 Tax=Polaribacter batillariae TaxID=2808900 RepID=A0ABX7SXD8_9FLAO|nr:hypothetical protein [Polaribacter batillariae]QTD38166.1 hypothetical protein JL193_02345 [Polaribacter batillariae]
MKSVILKYYLPIFALAFIFVAPIILINYEEDNFSDMIIGLSILVIFLTLILGTLNYKFGDKLAFNKRKKAIKKDLFQDFIYNGFDDNEVSVSGYVENYYVIISDERDYSYPNKWIEITILFNPKQQNQFIPNYIFKKLYKQGKNNYSWNSNSVTIKKVYGLKVPKYRTITNIIEEAIKILRDNNIASIKVEEWDLSLKASVTHYKQISSLKN